MVEHPEEVILLRTRKVVWGVILCTGNGSRCFLDYSGEVKVTEFLTFNRNCHGSLLSGRNILYMLCSLDELIPHRAVSTLETWLGKLPFSCVVAEKWS